MGGVGKTLEADEIAPREFSEYSHRTLTLSFEKYKTVAVESVNTDCTGVVVN